MSTTSPPAELLRVQGLCSGYGVSQVLFGVDLQIGEGEILGLLGRNGMGKTTFVRSVLGLIKPTQGTIAFGDRAIAGMAPHRRRRIDVNRRADRCGNGWKGDALAKEDAVAEIEMIHVLTA